MSGDGKVAAAVPDLIQYLSTCGEPPVEKGWPVAPAALFDNGASIVVGESAGQDSEVPMKWFGRYQAICDS